MISNQPYEPITFAEQFSRIAYLWQHLAATCDRGNERLSIHARAHCGRFRLTSPCRYRRGLHRSEREDADRLCRCGQVLVATTWSRSGTIAPSTLQRHSSCSPSSTTSVSYADTPDSIARNRAPWQSVAVAIDSIPSRRANPRRAGGTAGRRGPERPRFHGSDS